jgi:hypothetical protein
MNRKSKGLFSRREGWETEEGVCVCSSQAKDEKEAACRTSKLTGSKLDKLMHGKEVTEEVCLRPATHTRMREEESWGEAVERERNGETETERREEATLVSQRGGQVGRDKVSFRRQSGFASATRKKGMDELDGDEDPIGGGSPWRAQGPKSRGESRWLLARDGSQLLSWRTKARRKRSSMPTMEEKVP